VTFLCQQIGFLIGSVAAMVTPFLEPVVTGKVRERNKIPLSKNVQPQVITETVFADIICQ
jgi:hypothetical protein